MKAGSRGSRPIRTRSSFRCRKHLQEANTGWPGVPGHFFSGRLYAEDALRELRIDFGKFRRDRLTHQTQGFRVRFTRDRHIGRPVECKARMVVDLLHRVSRMDALEPEAPVFAAE